MAGRWKLSSKSLDDNNFYFFSLRRKNKTMKKYLLITSLLFSIILPSENAEGKCGDYLKYSFLHSAGFGNIMPNDTSLVINLNENDTLVVTGWAVDISGYGQCPAYFVFFYKDSSYIGGGYMGPRSVLISEAGNYSAHIGHYFYFKVAVIPVAGISETENNIPVNIFPNPATDEVTLRFNKEAHYVIELQNAVGEILFQTTNNSSEIKLDAVGLRKGIYFVRVTDENKNSVVRKIVKM